MKLSLLCFATPSLTPSSRRVVDVFRAAGKVVDVDSSKDRQDVWALVKEALSEWSTKDEELTERSECLLGMRPWPKREKKAE